MPDVLVDVAPYDVHALLARDHRDLQIRVQGAGELHAASVCTHAWTRDRERRARVRLELSHPGALSVEPASATARNSSHSSLRRTGSHPTAGSSRTSSGGR